MKRIFEGLDMEVTPIVAYGLVAISMIIGGLGISKLSSAVSDIGARTRAAKIEMHTLSTLQNEEVWAARLSQSQQIRKRVEGAILTGTTGGVVAADFQQSLRKTALASGMENLKVRVNPDVDDVQGVQAIQFTFGGMASDWDSALNFLSSMTERESTMIINEFSFRKGSRPGKARLSIAGLIPVKIQSAAPKPVQQEAQP